MRGNRFPRESRRAVRDLASGPVGATSEFVLLPDLKKKHLTLTTLMVGNTRPAIGLDHAAVRIFKPGQPVPYHINLLNPRLEHGDPFARVETQVRLFQGGKLIWSGAAARGESRVGHLSNALMVKGVLQMGVNSEPADYYSQVIASNFASG